MGRIRHTLRGEPWWTIVGLARVHRLLPRGSRIRRWIWEIEMRAWRRALGSDIDRCRGFWWVP